MAEIPESFREAEACPTRRESRLGRILGEYSDRTNAGEAFDVQGAIDANPDLAEDLMLALGALERIAPEAPSRDLQKRLGDYVLRRRIGRGGMGVVYEAWQCSMDRTVALKLLPPGLADERTMERFLREAQTAGRLHHPSIVSVYGMGVESETPYYAMELIDGDALARIISRVRDTSPHELDARYCLDVAEAFITVAQGLQHAHESGVVHRDLKPSNLIVDGRGATGGPRSARHDAPEDAREWPGCGQLRILDFGLARLEGQETVTESGDLLGTPQYMSPEQAKGRKVEIDHRTDIFSLGATLYEALTLEPPFRGVTPQDTLSQIASRDPVRPRRNNPRIPPDLETVVLKCLRKDPDDRYRTAEALAQDLRRAARGDPVEARPESRWTKLVRRTRRRRGLIVSGALLVVAFVAVAILAVRAHMADEALIAAEYDGKVLHASLEIRRERLLLGTGSGDALRNYARMFIGSGDLAFLLGDAYRARLEQLVSELAELSGRVPGRPDAPYHEARGLLLLGRRDEAVAALELALERDPEFAPARVLLRRVGTDDAHLAAVKSPTTRLWLDADFASREKRHRDAVRAFGELLDLHLRGQPPFSGAALDLHLEKGLAHLAARELDRARDEFAMACGLAGSHLEPWLLLGKTYARDGVRHPGRAEEIFKALHARNNDPDEAAETALWIALIYLSLGDCQAARPWIGRLGDVALAARLEGAAYFEVRNESKAIDAFERAVALDPGDGISRVFLGGCLYFSGEPDAGAERQSQIERVLELANEAVALGEARSNPSWVALGKVLRARARVDLGRIQEAVEDARAGLETAPPGSYAEYTAHWIGGAALSVAGEHDEAVAYLRKAATLEGETHRTSARQSLNVALQRQGRIDEANEVSRELATDAPAFAPVYFNWGYNLLRQRRYVEASEVFARGESAKPGSGGLTAGRVHALLGLGRVAEALDVAQTKLEAAKEGREEHSPQLLFVYGKALARSGRPEEAIASVAGALGRVPFDPYMRRKLARLLHSRPRAGEAPELVSLARVLEENRHSPRAGPGYKSTLALVLLHASREEDVEILERALAAANDAVDSSHRQEPEALVSLAEVLLARGEVSSAILALEEAVRLPHATLLHLERLEALQSEAPLPLSFASVDADLKLAESKADHAAVAAERLQRLAESDEPKLDALRAYLDARELHATGEFRKAAERFSDLASRQPDAPEPWLGLTESLVASGDREAARAELRRGILGGVARAPEVWERWVDMCLGDPGQSVEEAIESLLSGLPSGPQYRAGAPEAETLRAHLVALRDEGAIRIDCGGAGLRAKGGGVWTPDVWYFGGRERRRPYRIDIAGTDEDALYQSGRVFEEDALRAGYRIPLPGGSYHVALHFAEVLIRGAGERCFEVSLEGEAVVEEFEPLEHGFATAVVLSFPRTDVRDGLLHVDLISRRGGAEISGIEIVQEGE